jgi:glutathione synthase/RimK-type ligase-like ATP-grasp enzyme
MAAKQTVLIASSSADIPNYGKVAEHLEQRGFRVIIYAPNTIANARHDFSMRLDANGAMRITYDGQRLDVAKIHAAWYRRPDFYGKPKDKQRWQAIKDEYHALQNNIWALIPNDTWLNAPDNMKRADVKMQQLAAAAAAGFRIPETVISNTWDMVEAFQQDRLIVKMIERISLPAGNGTKSLPTTIVRRDNLPKQALPYPGLWQPYIQKKREWRITVVGEKVFSAAIYTEESAKDDWRTHQFGPAVVFKAEPFPKEEQQKCIALLKHFKLRYGAFDFVETPGGEIIFLEVNTNGQFMWLEDQLGLPISEAIAEELITIAAR